MSNYTGTILPIYSSFSADYIKAKDMYQVSKMDDIWFESVLNEPETFRNGVAVLMDVKGYVVYLIICNLRVLWLLFPVHVGGGINENV